MTKRNGFIDAYETKNEVIVWSRDFNGKLIEDAFPVTDYLYCYIKANRAQPNIIPMKDIYKNEMKQVFFDSKWDLVNYRKTRANLCESDVRLANRVLLDEFGDCHMDTPMNTIFYDIEVAFDLSDGKGYPTPENPHGEINCIQFYDVALGEYVILTLTEGYVITDKYDNIPVNVIDCISETDLLRTFSDAIDHVDIMLGWYTESFDIPYIMARSIKLFGEDRAMRMYCRGGYKASKREFYDENKSLKVSYGLVGRQNTDMMELYKKFIPSEKKSFSLDAVCQEDLNMSKLEYEKDLGTLYRENPIKFLEYALHDARLLKMLNDKHKIVELMINMTRSSCVTCRDATGSVKLIEHDLMKFCRNKGIVLPDKKDNIKEKYEGAVVYDTISGRAGWSGSVDLTSLYPKTMEMLGLSTETMIYQCFGEYEDYVHVMTENDEFGEITMEAIPDGTRSKILPSELYKKIRENGWCISAAGTIFNGEMGILAQYVHDGFELRSEYKRLMGEAYKRNDIATAEMYDLYQKVVKVARLNAVYGASGNENFRLYDIRLAKSITLSAQIISKQQAYAANKFIQDCVEIVEGGV